MKLVLMSLVGASLLAQRGPANVAVMGVSVSQSAKAGIAAYGRRVACAGPCMYVYNQGDFQGAVFAPSYRLTTGAAVSLFHIGADWEARGKFSANVWGLGDIGIAQESVATAKPFTLDTLTSFARGGGVLATVHLPRLPFSVGARARYLVGGQPEYTAVVLYGWGQ